MSVDTFDHVMTLSTSFYVCIILLIILLVLLPNVEHLYLRHIAVDTLDRYQPDTEASHH